MGVDGIVLMHVALLSVKSRWGQAGTHSVVGYSSGIGAGVACSDPCPTLGAPGLSYYIGVSARTGQSMARA